MKYFSLIILVVICTSCSTKMLVKKPYSDASIIIKEFVKSNFKIESNEIEKNNLNGGLLIKNRDFDARFYKINVNSSYWSINHGERYNKIDTVMPKYTIIKLSNYKNRFTKIKIDSYEMGLFSRSKNYYRQKEMADQIANYLNKNGALDAQKTAR